MKISMILIILKQFLLIKIGFSSVNFRSSISKRNVVEIFDERYWRIVSSPKQ